MADRVVKMPLVLIVGYVHFTPMTLFTSKTVMGYTLAEWSDYGLCSVCNCLFVSLYSYQIEVDITGIM